MVSTPRTFASIGEYLDILLAIFGSWLLRTWTRRQVTNIKMTAEEAQEWDRWIIDAALDDMLKPLITSLSTCLVPKVHACIALLMAQHSSAGA